MNLSDNLPVDCCGIIISITGIIVNIVSVNRTGLKDVD
jgi:hypothetical protein